MAEKGTQSIYDIDFAVLDEKKYSEAVKVPAAVLMEEISQNGLTPEPITSVAVATELVAEPPVVAQPTEVVIHIPRPVETPPPYVPPEYVELAQTTLDTLLATYTKPVVPIALIVDTAFGQKPSKQDYENLKNALKQDPRLEYLGSRDFRVVELEVKEPYWPGESPNIDTDKVDELAERIIKDLVDRALSKVFHWQMLERVRSEYLNNNETNEILAQVASNPEISAHENGSFSARLSDEELENLIEERDTLSLDFGRKPEVPDKPMTSSQIGWTMKKINRSYAVRKAADLAKRKANPRRRGRRKKNNFQGRLHNKAQRVQKLIAQMDEAIPQAKIATKPIEVKEPDDL
ncbi:hypothetical protein BVY00_02170, partial [bacterium G20]